MAQEVTLPQLGESVTEGIITEWLVEVGDTVETDQPLVEISTDKVDTEIPSPVAGTVQELKAEVDDTVEVGQVIAIIGESDAESGDGEAGPTDEAEGDADGADAEEDSAEEDGDEEDGDEKDGDEKDGDAAEEATEAAANEAGTPEETEEAAEQEADTSGEAASEAAEEPDEAVDASDATPAQAPAAEQTDGDGAGDKALTSPLVRKLLREAGISPGQVEGSGKGGRITRADAEQAIASGGTRQPPPTEGTAAASPSAPAPAAQRERPEESPLQVDFGGERQVAQDLSRVRKAIAKAMQASLQQTAQLTAAVEVDVTRVMQLRAAVKDDFKAHYGVSLSPLPFFVRAACMTIPRHPAINGSIDLEEGTATFHRYINLGLAVDTERGLLVPNIKDAQDLNIPGLANEIADIADKTRGKGLTPDDIQGGTFTITNTGSRGTLFDTPILNPPEVAILATCAIQKRPVVVQDELGGDSISVRSMMYLCLTYDHRMIDGADAARFLQDLKWVIETHDFSSEVMV